MKILVTSMMPVETKFGWINNVTMVVAALREFGHDVDYRAVTVGEDLSKYDLAFINISNLGHIGTKKLRYGCAWAAINLPSIFTLSDDSIMVTMGHLNPLKFWSTGPKISSVIYEERKKLLAFETQVDDWLSDILSWRWLLPTFTWGSQCFIHLKGLYTVYDPSIFVPLLGKPKEKKKKVWVSASINKWKAKPQTEWPLNEFVMSVSEKFLVNVCYAEATGLFIRPSFYRRSGWWRSRYNYAAQTETIAVTFACDCPLTHYNYTIKEIEQASDQKLKTIAEAQKNELESKYMTKNQICEVFNGLLKIRDRRISDTCITNSSHCSM